MGRTLAHLLSHDIEKKRGLSLICSVLCFLGSPVMSQTNDSQQMLSISPVPERPSNQIQNLKGTYYRFNSGTLSKSSDSKSWDVVLFDPQRILQLANGMIVEEESNKLYLSADAGNSWTTASLPFGLDAPIGDITSSGNKLYVETSTGIELANPKPNRVFVADVSLPDSSGGGSRWSELHPPCSRISKIAVAVDSIAVICDLPFKDPSNLVFLSVDAGRTWRAYGDLDSEISEQEHVTLLVRNENVLVSTDEHLYRYSLRGGRTEWTDISPVGYSGSAGLSGAKIFAATSVAIKVSTDEGAHWSTALRQYSEVQAEDSFAVVLSDQPGKHSPQDPSLIGVTRDGGEHWASMASPPEHVDNAAVHDKWIIAHCTSHVYRKQIESDNWTPIKGVSPEGTRELVVIDSKPLLVGFGVYVVNGKSWLPSLPPPSTRIYRMVRLGNRQRCFWSTTGVFLTDDGERWTSLAPFENLNDSGTVSSVFASAGSLYVLTRPSSFLTSNSPSEPVKILATQDNKSWSEFAILPPGFFPKSFAVDSEGIAYAKTDNAILQRYPQQEWQNIYTGMLLGTKPVSLAVDSKGVLFVGTSRGLFWSSNHGKDWHKAAPALLSGRVSFDEMLLDSDFEITLEKSKRFLCHSRILLADTFSVVLGKIGSLESAEGIPVVDGHEIRGAWFESDPQQGLILRGNSSALKNVPDGVHRVTAKLSSAAREVSFEAYVYTELAKAYIFKPYDHSFAVVVAASGKWAPNLDNLTEAVPQAKKVAEFLHSIGFEDVKEFYEENATAANVDEYINELAAKVGKNDRVIFYFAGHGITRTNAENEKDGYLLTYPATVANVQSKALPMFRLQGDFSKRLDAKHVLYVLDACFSGLAIKEGVEPQRVTKFLRYEELSKYTNAYTRAILAAGQAGEPALDKNGGIFTKAFMEALQGKAADEFGILTVQDVYYYVKKRVGEQADLLLYHQTPRLQERGDGEFVFLAK